jgi:16S rRNA (cytosine967-C5)-methyltransferase
MTVSPKPVPKKTAPKNRAAKISPARKQAFDILLAVERGHAHSDDLLRGGGVNALAAADRNLTTALVLGVLRWQIQLDARIRPLLTRPQAKLDVEILIALRIGAFQMLHMGRIPARAAIDESVELTKQAGHRFASAMVNAVLRKFAGTHRRDGKFTPGGEMAFTESHPAWMVERWVEFYGVEAARAVCRHGQIQPGHTLRLVNLNAMTELAEAGVVAEPGQLLTSACTVLSGDAGATAAFTEGRVRMQDEGSQLVAEIAAASLGQLDGRILDACAAPGGKTMILAERSPEASIVACEWSEPRLEQLRHRLAPYADRIECRLADTTQAADDSAFDLVLADVPCSGTGTLGRNPEIRHRLRLEDLARQAERQQAILTAGLRAVRPGGRVVYSTCSLEPEENEHVVQAVIAAGPNASVVSVQLSIEAMLRSGVVTQPGAEGLLKSLTPHGALRLLPGALQTDGFFVAILERRK